MGGGRTVATDWSDWRSWPAEREGRKQAVIREVEALLHEAIVMRDDATRREMMVALTALTTDLSSVRL